jgi:hypothetical protein
MTEMNRYANGKIYMIESASAGLCYYGSTCMALHKRLFHHKSSYKKNANVSSEYVTSFKILDYEDHKIVLVEEFPCENKQQLLAREAHYIRTNECVNKCIPGRTRKQHYDENKEKISEKRKEKKVCVCGSMINIGGGARHERTSKHIDFIKNISESDSR